VTGLLEGKVAIITGAGRGIGSDMALVFVREGARVVLAGRTLSSLQESAERVKAAGGESICVVTDVGKAEDCRKLVEATVRKFSRIDCAVNNAAIDGPQLPTVQYPEKDFDDVMQTNVKGVWNCMRYQIAAMSSGGSIVNISSAVIEPAVPNMSAYVASKYAVIGLTKTAALEYAAKGIRVNAVVPGVVETKMVSDIFTKYPAMRDPMLAKIASRRFGTCDEIGNAAAWLCSDRAAYVMGATLLVDGGFSLE
jgi:NAD(P)-dependent dehydrogenase (short-subunit alcohol dehydrogenase family)